MNSPVRCAALAAALTAALLAGCASSPKTAAIDETAEVQVGARAQQRWQALIDGDWATAYSLLTPGYREVNTVDAYRANFAGSTVKWTSTSIHSVDCDTPQRCTARINVSYELEGGMPGVSRVASTQMIEETWLQVRSGWYHLPRR